jgi:hypothetical protein
MDLQAFHRALPRFASQAALDAAPAWRAYLDAVYGGPPPLSVFPITLGRLAFFYANKLPMMHRGMERAFLGSVSASGQLNRTKGIARAEALSVKRSLLAASRATGQAHISSRGGRRHRDAFIMWGGHDGGGGFGTGNIWIYAYDAPPHPPAAAVLPNMSYVSGPITTAAAATGIAERLSGVAISEQFAGSGLEPTFPSRGFANGSRVEVYHCTEV